MYKNTLLALLRSLERKEMSRFQAFVRSPYFNKHEDVQALVDYLNELYPSFEEKKCAKELVARAVFGHTKSIQKLPVIFTYTKRLLFQFLSVEQLEQEKDRQSIYVLQQLRQREQLQTYEQQLKKYQNEVARKEERDIAYHFELYQFREEQNNYFEQQRAYKQDDSLMLKQQSFNTFFIAEKLSDACEILSRQSTLQLSFSDRWLDLILEELATHWADYADISAVVVYYQIYQLLQQQTFEAYTASLESLEQYASTFSIREQKRAYQYLQNFCASQINAGKADYLKHLFELFRVRLNKNLLLENGYLPEWHYKNIVIAGLRLGKQQWVKTFIENYKAQLHPEQRDHAYAFNLASYFYYYKEYEKALQQLLYLDVSDVRYAITAKSMLLYIYYELEETEALLTLSNTFKQYLNRRKDIAKNYSQGVKHLIQFTRQLAQLRAKKGFEAQDKWQQRFDDLQQAIEAENNIVNRKWLMEKVSNLK